MQEGATNHRSLLYPAARQEVFRAALHGAAAELSPAVSLRVQPSRGFATSSDSSADWSREVGRASAPLLGTEGGSDLTQP